MRSPEMTTVQRAAVVLLAGIFGAVLTQDAGAQGKLGAKGGRLTGQQSWTYDGKSHTRECTMTVNAP